MDLRSALFGLLASKGSSLAQHVGSLTRRGGLVTELALRVAEPMSCEEIPALRGKIPSYLVTEPPRCANEPTSCASELAGCDNIPTCFDSELPRRDEMPGYFAPVPVL